MNLDPKQILEYVKESSGLLAAMQEKVASLETEKSRLTAKVKEGNKALAEKEASEKREQTPVFTREQVRPVMEKLAKAKRIKDVDASTDRILEDPSGLLLALDKMAAEAISSVPTRKLGSSVEKVAQEGERESDRQFETRFLSLGQKF
jgi:hypothetical protein